MEGVRRGRVGPARVRGSRCGAALRRELGTDTRAVRTSHPFAGRQGRTYRSLPLNAARHRTRRSSLVARLPASSVLRSSTGSAEVCSSRASPRRSLPQNRGARWRPPTRRKQIASLYARRTAVPGSKAFGAVEDAENWLGKDASHPLGLDRPEGPGGAASAEVRRHPPAVPASRTSTPEAGRSPVVRAAAPVLQSRLPRRQH